MLKTIKYKGNFSNSIIVSSDSFCLIISHINIASHPVEVWFIPVYLVDNAMKDCLSLKL